VLPIRVGDEVFVLGESSAADLMSRLPRPALEGGEPIADTLEAKLQDALRSQVPANLDRGELAIIGATVEAWATEIAVDAADVQDLRDAIAERLT
jgi:hypothetical protein